MYTRRAQSYQNTLHKVLYGNIHTPRNDCSRNCVLILVGVEILWEEEGFQCGFKRWQGWTVSQVLWVWIPNKWCGVQSHDLRRLYAAEFSAMVSREGANDLDHSSVSVSLSHTDTDAHKRAWVPKAWRRTDHRPIAARSLCGLCYIDV